MSTARLSLRATAATCLAGLAVITAAFFIQAPTATTSAMCALDRNSFAPAHESDEFYADEDSDAFNRMMEQYNYVPGGNQPPKEENCEQ
jgi:hypothetical protein